MKSFAESIADDVLANVTEDELNEIALRLSVVNSFETTSDGKKLFSKRQQEIIEAMITKFKVGLNVSQSTEVNVPSTSTSVKETDDLESMVDEFGIFMIEKCTGQYELIQRDVVGYEKVVNTYKSDLNKLVKDLVRYEFDLKCDYRLSYVPHTMERPPVHYANIINKIKDLYLAKEETRFLKNEGIVHYCKDGDYTGISTKAGFDMYGNLIIETSSDSDNRFAEWRDIQIYNDEDYWIDLSNTADDWTYFMWRGKVYTVEFEKLPSMINIVECDFHDGVRRKTILTKEIEYPTYREFLDLHCFALRIFICDVLNK